MSVYLQNIDDEVNAVFQQDRVTGAEPDGYNFHWLLEVACMSSCQHLPPRSPAMKPTPLRQWCKPSTSLCIEAVQTSLDV